MANLAFGRQIFWCTISNCETNPCMWEWEGLKLIVLCASYRCFRLMCEAQSASLRIVFVFSGWVCYLSLRIDWERVVGWRCDRICGDLKLRGDPRERTGTTPPLLSQDPRILLNRHNKPGLQERDKLPQNKLTKLKTIVLDGSIMFRQVDNMIFCTQVITRASFFIMAGRPRGLKVKLAFPEKCLLLQKKIL